MTQAIEQVERSANRLAGTGFGLLWMNAVSFQLISSADRFTFTWLIDDTLKGPSWAQLYRALAPMVRSCRSVGYVNLVGCWVGLTSCVYGAWSPLLA